MGDFFQEVLPDEVKPASVPSRCDVTPQQQRENPENTGWVCLAHFSIPISSSELPHMDKTNQLSKSYNAADY